MKIPLYLLIFLVSISVVSALDVSYTIHVTAVDGNGQPATAQEDFTKNCADTCSYSMPSFMLPENSTVSEYEITYAATTAYQVYFDSTNNKKTIDSNDDIVVEVIPAAPTCNKDSCDKECVKCSDKMCHEPGFICKEEVAIERVFPTQTTQGIGQINILLINKGTVDLKNLAAELSGNGIATIESIPIQTLVAGDKDYTFVKVNISKSGKIDAVVTLLINGQVKGKFVQQFDIAAVAEVPQEQKPTYNVTLFTEVLSQLKEEYRTLEQDYQDKKIEGYPVDIIYDKLRAASSRITETQSALLEGNYRAVQAGLSVLEDSLEDIALSLKSVRKQEETFADKVKDKLLFFGAMAAAIVSIFTAYKLLSTTVDKEKLAALHKKVASMKKGKKAPKKAKKKTAPKKEEKKEEPAA
ncbi:MAG TPA: hypothetical protein VKE88_02820 [Candidatus Nanoarchaeia archaeon]|nr:hypothetical protein [Candidatus Nanoarchaeia archaeon]